MKLLTKIIISCVLLSIPITARATDMPIDVDTITGLDDEQKEAITRQRGVDIFSDAAFELSETIIINRENSRIEAQHSILSAPKDYHLPDANMLFTHSLKAADLFATPSRYTINIPLDEETEMPIWMYIILFTGASAIGLLLAIRTRAKKMEKK